MATETRADKRPLVLSLRQVTLGYPGVVAVSEASFDVWRGEFIGIVGPNGSGKSTLLQGILGLLPPRAGEIELLGCRRNHLHHTRGRLGYVPQKSKCDARFPVSAAEVVLMGLYAQIGWLRRPGREHWRRAHECLEIVGLAAYAGRRFGELSGGQQQRVLIARALAPRPLVLLLDEPTAAVDISAQQSILETIQRLHREQGLTVLMVSHDLNEIVHVCDRILLLDKRVVGFGAPNEVLTKENLQTVYGNRVFVYDHEGHPHVLVGDFHD